MPAKSQQLRLLSTSTIAPPTFKQVRLVELWCAEPVFFASREISDCYYTEGVLGNYALAYALDWVSSPYRLVGQATGRPTYLEDLVPIAQDSYILPAWAPEGRVTFRFERFNALSDAYWYSMTNNRVATAREDLPEYRRLQKAKGQDKPRHRSFSASNFPQTGRLRMIDRGNVFHTLVFGGQELPEYFRIGKFRSKVRLSVLQEFELVSLPPGEYTSQALLNTADLPPDLELLVFDLISIPPVSLIKNVRFRGSAWQIGEFILPANLQFCGGRITSGT
ncbi:MAG: type I-D CRISPR-associated protein Cas5/Csc1 [Cyanobacteria bacterium M5B4]|nr:MAG: type I-D CRISPR-associated protein Cas5/Csc1 [Cyanobacteria bacterium M5B4]